MHLVSRPVTKIKLQFVFSGGGDTTMNGDNTPSPQDNITSGYDEESATTEPGADTTSLPDSTPLNSTSDDIGTLDDADSIT